MASDDSEFALERGISQVLHSYAPEDVVNFGQLGVVVKVGEWTHGGRMEDVDKDRIADVVRGRASRFRNRTSSTDWDSLGPGDIDVFQPGKAKAGMFPLVFYCEECGKVETASQPQYLPNSGTCRATDCDGNLTQLPFVNVHECGKIEGPGPNNGCHSHDFNDYRLVKTSGAPATWYYECRECGERMGKLVSSCSRCDEGMSGPLPASSNRVQYTQSAVVIDVPFLDEDPSDVPSGEPWARTLMAVYLGEAELGGHTLESLAATAGNAEKYKQLIEKWDQEMVDDVIETMDVPVRGREVAAEQTRHVVPPEVNDAVDGLPEVAYSQIGRQLFTFLRSTEGYEGDADDLGDTRHPIPDSLSDYLSDEEFVKRHPQSKRYVKQLARTHIRDAWVVDQFPLLNLSFGYTRDSPTPRKTDVHEFPHPTSLNNTPVFADRTPSEAIVFEVDRAHPAARDVTVACRLQQPLERLRVLDFSGVFTLRGFDDAPNLLASIGDENGGLADRRDAVWCLVVSRFIERELPGRSRFLERDFSDRTVRSRLECLRCLLNVDCPSSDCHGVRHEQFLDPTLRSPFCDGTMLAHERRRRANSIGFHTQH